MDFKITKLPSNMGTDNIMVNGYSFTKSYVYKSAEISWRCTARRGNCNARIRTNADCTAIVGGKFTHAHEPNSDRTVDRKVFKNGVKRKVEDGVVTSAGGPTKLVRAEFEKLDAHALEEHDLRLVAKALSSSRKQKMPQKTRHFAPQISRDHRTGDVLKDVPPTATTAKTGNIESVV